LQQLMRLLEMLTSPPAMVRNLRIERSSACV
jgi:hypothetical protein